MKKEVIKSELVTALTDMGVLPCNLSVVTGTSSAGMKELVIQLPLKELELTVSPS